MTFRHIPVTLINEIRALYAAPNRFYHSLNHLDHLMSVKDQLIGVYDQYDRVADWDDLGPQQINDYLSLAILFHDAEYNIWEGSPVNEQRSVYLMWNYSDVLSNNGWNHTDINEVARMIWATATHNKNNESLTFLEKLMLDIDISNFAESFDVCKYNQNQIFLEFEPRFPYKNQFLAGNVYFLKSLLDRPTLYYTPMFSVKEQIARQNIEDMIKGI